MRSDIFRAYEEGKMKHFIEMLIENSRTVAEDCERKVTYWTEKEQYFKANEARVTATIHRAYNDWLMRILKGLPPFHIQDKPEEQSEYSDIYIE